MANGAHVSEWWTGLAPVEISVRCAGSQHRIRWERGALIACDHGDLEDERALAVLAGERCACIELLDAWALHVTDLRALRLAPREISDPARSSAWVSSPGARGGHIPVPAWEARGLPIASEPQIGRFPIYPRSWDDGEAELIALLGLGSQVGARLVATVAAHWSQRLTDGTVDLAAYQPRLRSALHGRLQTTLRTWLGDPELSVMLEPIAADEPRSLTRTNRRITARLPFAWLAEVWARNLQIVEGRFCLAADATDGNSWELTTVARDLAAPDRIAVTAAA